MPAPLTEQRVAIVTGASRGIGRAIAERLAADGRHVALVARSEGAVKDVAGSIVAAGGAATAFPCDMADRAAVARMVETVAEKLGRLDILVNNAGITRDNLILRMSDAEWDEVLAVNLTGVFTACRAAARPMMKGKFGRIVNIASTSGVVGNAGQSNYAAAKAGVIGLTKSVARELGGKGITANIIAPGFVETDMTAALGDELKQRVLAGMAVRQLGVPGDIAAAASYLTSDAAGYVTGQVLCVDGGLTMC